MPTEAAEESPSTSSAISGLGCRRCGASSLTPSLALPPARCRAFRRRHQAWRVFPEILRRRHAVDVAVHGLLEQDGAHHLVASEGGRLDDPRAHLVNEVEHLRFIRPGAFVDAVKLERFRCRATRLIKRCNEAVLVRGLRGHFLVHLFLLSRAISRIQYVNARSSATMPLPRPPISIDSIGSVPDDHALPVRCQPFSTSTPGSSLPSIHSRKAPPAVET